MVLGNNMRNSNKNKNNNEAQKLPQNNNTEKADWQNLQGFLILFNIIS